MAMALRQQRVQPRRNGVSVIRVLQTSFEQWESLGAPAAVGIGQAEVEQYEGIVGTLGQVQLQ